MRLQPTKTFAKDFRQLPENIKKAVHKQLTLLLSNPRHPSLNFKKMRDPRDIWEARISDSYRFTFQIKGDVYILRKVGTHDILKKL
jgi:mRNA-degrading endonuclease RelE of RelBE toxin-antitoxin system